MNAGDRRSLEALLAPRDEPPAGALSNVLVFGWRAILKIKRIPEQIFDVLVTPVMFTVLFTWLFGNALAGSTDAYLQYLLPGVLVQIAVFTSVYTGFTLNNDLSRGVYDRFRSMPIWKPAPLVGALLGDTFRFTAASLVGLTVGLVMGYRPPAGVLGVVASIAILDAFALGIAWIFVTFALVVRTPSTVLTASWFVLFPLTFLSNVYVDPATLPAWLQDVVAANPVTHVVAAIRRTMAGEVRAADVGLALLTPGVVAAIFAPLSVRLYGRTR